MMDAEQPCLDVIQKLLGAKEELKAIKQQMINHNYQCCLDLINSTSSPEQRHLELTKLADLLRNNT